MRQSAMITRALRMLPNCQSLRSRSRDRPLNGSIHAFCHGLPGSINTLAVSLNRHQFAGASATSSGPLSVQPQERGRPAALEPDAVEGFDNVIGVDRVIDLDREGFGAELVDDVEHLDRTPRGDGAELEIDRPQGVGSDRAHRPDTGSDPAETLPALLLPDPEAFVAPQPRDPLVVHLSARAARFVGCSSPSPPRSTPRELAQVSLRGTR